MAKTKYTFQSSLSKLTEIKGTYKKLGAAHEDLYEKLLELYSGDLRQVVDQVAALKAEERKVYIAGFTDLAKRLKKLDTKTFAPPPKAQMKHVARSFGVVLGWVKNRQKYKTGELLPPTSNADLQRLQDVITEKTCPPQGSMAYEEGRRGLFLPSSFTDCYRICNGTSVRMHQGLRLLPLEEVHERYVEVDALDLPGSFVPIGDDGAGNLFLLSASGELYDLNHEDQSLNAIFPSLGVFLCKPHKITR